MNLYQAITITILRRALAARVMSMPRLNLSHLPRSKLLARDCAMPKRPIRSAHSLGPSYQDQAFKTTVLRHK